MSGGAKKGRPRVRLTSGFDPFKGSTKKRSTKKRSTKKRSTRTTSKKRQKATSSHRPRVQEDEALGWTAVCTCGWSAKRGTRLLAIRARDEHRRRPKRPKSSKRSMPNRAVHKLSLDDRPDGRWIAKCKCGWKNEKPTRVEAEKVLQSLCPVEVSVAEAKRNIRLQERLDRARKRKADRTGPANKAG